MSFPASPSNSTPITPRRTCGAAFPGSAPRSTNARGRCASASCWTIRTCGLRDKSFGTARIILRSEPHAVVVRREAVQSTDGSQFVFVRDKDYLKRGPAEGVLRAASPHGGPRRGICRAAGRRAARRDRGHDGKFRSSGAASPQQPRRGLRLRQVKRYERAEPHHRFFAAQPAPGDCRRAGRRDLRRNGSFAIGCRRLSRHHARAGADQHRRSRARARGGRAADHVSHRAGA